MCRANVAVAGVAGGTVTNNNPVSIVGGATIFASRYKTKFCRHYTEDSVTGEFSCKCPYKKKCMFAHRPEELRTTEQNIAEGINTKSDIQNLKKHKTTAAKQQLQGCPLFDRTVARTEEDEIDFQFDGFHQNPTTTTATNGHTSSSSDDGSHDAPHTRSDCSDVSAAEVTNLAMTPTNMKETPAAGKGAAVRPSHPSMLMVTLPIECKGHRRALTVEEQTQGYHTHQPYGGAEFFSWAFNPACTCAQCSVYSEQHV